MASLSSPPVHSAARAGRRLKALALGVSLSVLSFFAALTIAYLQRGAPARMLVPLPPVLYPNTAVLLLSSGALQISLRRLRAGHMRAMLRWLAAAFILGWGFLGGQYWAWRQWRRAGVFLRTDPGSRFFFLFTAAHAIHIAAGLAVLGAVFTLAWRGRLRPERPAPLEAAAIFWHCLDAAWLGLLALLLLA